MAAALEYSSSQQGEGTETGADSLYCIIVGETSIHAYIANLHQYECNSEREPAFYQLLRLVNDLCACVYIRTSACVHACVCLCVCYKSEMDVMVLVLSAQVKLYVHHVNGYFITNC